MTNSRNRSMRPTERHRRNPPIQECARARGRCRPAANQRVRQAASCDAVRDLQTRKVSILPTQVASDRDGAPAPDRIGIQKKQKYPSGSPMARDTYRGPISCAGESTRAENLLLRLPPLASLLAWGNRLYAHLQAGAKNETYDSRCGHGQSPPDMYRDDGQERRSQQGPHAAASRDCSRGQKPSVASGRVPRRPSRQLRTPRSSPTASRDPKEPPARKRRGQER